MLHDVFISYTQPDRETAFRTHDLFEASGLRSWIAVSPSHGISQGADYEGEIVRAIKASSVYVLIWSQYGNRSENILRELRQYVKGRPIIPFLLDYTAPSENISLYIEGKQHIDGRRNLSQALNELLIAVRRYSITPGAENDTPTDKLLLNAGLELLRQRNYTQAATRLRQYYDIAPSDPDAAFYLTLALIARTPTKKLDGLVVKRLEGILPPTNGAARLLLAILKAGYYTCNGFRVPAPSPEQLLTDVTIDGDAAAALLEHLDETRDNLVWRHVHQLLTNQ
jgi:hypothetical protein